MKNCIQKNILLISIVKPKIIIVKINPSDIINQLNSIELINIIPSIDLKVLTQIPSDINPKKTAIIEAHINMDGFHFKDYNRKTIELIKQNDFQDNCIPYDCIKLKSQICDQIKFIELQNSKIIDYKKISELSKLTFLKNIDIKKENWKSSIEDKTNIVNIFNVKDISQCEIEELELINHLQKIHNVGFSV